MFFFCLFVLELYNLSPSTSVVLEETLQRGFAVNLICLIHANIQVNKKQNFPEVFYFIYFYLFLFFAARYQAEIPRNLCSHSRNIWHITPICT